MTKPKISLRVDGNFHSLKAYVLMVLEKEGLVEDMRAYGIRAKECNDYSSLLNLSLIYVEVV